MSTYDGLASLLVGYFCNMFYREGILALKRDIKNHTTYAAAWSRMVETIEKRTLLPGQPLELVNYKANQVLDENSDEEAYRWLDLMIKNVQRSDGEIEDY